MAGTLVPLATTAIDYQVSPTITPPSTDFPYPDSTDRLAKAERVDSDATLYDANDDLGGHPVKIESKTQSISDFSRPNLGVKRFETEMPRPVAQRPVQPFHQRRSTGARRAVRLDIVAPPSSDFSDGWSSEEDPIKLKRSRTQPEYNHLSTGRLNQTKKFRRPSFARRPTDGGKLKVENEHFSSRGRVGKDGRLNITVNETANSGYLAKALGATIDRHLRPQTKHEIAATEKLKRTFTQTKDSLQIPQLNIVIMVIGSRGDIQPFLKIGKILQDKYHHRVRIATHPAFKKFVEEDIGLEFFSVGGDPSELMAFMVKNPGLIPSLETVKAGEIGRRRESMFEMFQGFWRACINATDDEKDVANLKMMGNKFPFVADAIIANPPSFAHYHCAERLSIPLHLVFTFPYSPTQSFPHPLANIKATNIDQSYTNFMSYPLIDLMTWQGLGDLVNRFRVQTLGLEPVSTLWAPGQLSRLKVPMTYLWSPGLVPKPDDWGPEIDIAGYVFLELASSFKPPEDLSKFLERSDDRPLIYIGFGSIAGIDDPTAFTKMVFEGVEKAGVRAVISKGWGGMGDGLDKPDGVFLVDNVPHDWLFPKVDAVVHHGGAGTTAAGLKFGKPTMIVPFFGDQPFWAAMVARAGAGAKQALPLKKLNSDRFAQGIKECLEPKAKEKALEIAKSIEKEGDGAENAIDSFHRALPLDGQNSMRCGIFPDRVAVWHVKHTTIRLSALAADLLIENKQLQWNDLSIIKHYEWTDFQGPGEPITGAGGVLISAFQEAFHSLSNIPEITKRDYRKYEKRKRRKKGKSITNAVVIPGQIAHATRGTTIQGAKEAREKEKAELNLQGQAEPAMIPFWSSKRNKKTRTKPPNLRRTTTTSTDEISAPAIIMKDVGKGIGYSAKAIVRLPTDMWYAMTQGFRNAPRLYGDRTVRAPPRPITGFRTGVKVAGSELWLGLYDGVSGLVRIPYQDVHESGISGLPKGVARGVGGFVLKPIAGVMGVPAYTSKGVQQFLRKQFRDTQKTERWIRRARMTQGAKDMQDLQKKVATDSVRPPPDAPNSNELEQLRSRALTCWTSHEGEIRAQALEKDGHGSIALPSKSRGDRARTT